MKHELSSRWFGWFCALIFIGASLAGCSEAKDAIIGAKGTSKMQNRREKRNTDAINIVDGKD